MKVYEIEFSPGAKKELGKLDRSVQERIAEKIKALAGNPRPTGSEALQGYPRLFRIRAGEYRVIYTVDEGRIVVVVVRVADRKEVYKKLDRLR